MDINPIHNVGVSSWIETGIDVMIDYTIWFPKPKAGKQGVTPSWESAKPTNKIYATINNNNVLSFKSAKSHILSEINKHKLLAVTILSAADSREGDLGHLKWHAYIATSKKYPKTSNRMAFITSKSEWKEWLEICNVSRDKTCGLHIMMQNPAIEQKKKRQNESLLIQASKIKRKRDRQTAQCPKKTAHRNGLTAEEMELDEHVELTHDEKSPDSGESTGGDTDTDAVNIVSDEIFKRHPIQSSYNTSVPVYVDPTDKDRFFYITSGMARIWARAKLSCDVKGNKVVTIEKPPKAAGIKWLDRKTEQAKRLKAGSSGDSSLRDMALMIKEVFGSTAKPPLDPPESTAGPVLEAPMTKYLAFCKIKDPDGSIEARLARAGIDQYSLLNQDFLPREDLIKLDLDSGTIARLYMNVKGFSKTLNDENVH